MEGMARPSTRDTFSLRFKNPRNREALRRMSEATGTPMTDLIEMAVEHEMVLLSADLERRLEEALAVVRSYKPERDLESYIAAAAAGEEDGDLGAGLVVQATRKATAAERHPQGDVAAEVLAAFSR
jgi:hypothetical protein